MTPDAIAAAILVRQQMPPPKGDKGDTGPEGPQGVDGLQGPQGPEGPQGVPGEAGLDGAVGLQGLQGPEGKQGPIGPKGPVGPKGPKGDKGDPGQSVWASGGSAVRSMGSNVSDINFTGTGVSEVIDGTVATVTINSTPPPAQVVFVQPADPGAVGAGALWVDTTTPGTSDQYIQRRNAANTGWFQMPAIVPSDTGVPPTPTDLANYPMGTIWIDIFQGYVYRKETGELGDYWDAGVDIDGTGGFGLVLNNDANISLTGAASGAMVITTTGIVVNTTFGLSLAGNTGSAGQVFTAQGDTTALWQYYIPPTFDPHVVGALWNNAGTLTISAG